MWFFGFQKKRKVAERYDARCPGTAFATSNNPYTQPSYSSGGGHAMYNTPQQFYPGACPPPPRHMTGPQHRSNRHPPALLPQYQSTPARSVGKSAQSSSVATGSDWSARSYASQPGRPTPASGRRVTFGRVDVREFSGGRRGGGT